MHQPEIFFLVISTVHSLQDTAASGLHRKMQMMTDFPAFGHHCDQFVGQILRMGRHKTDAADPFDLLCLTEKLREGDRRIKGFSVRIDILSKKHDLRNAVFCKLFDLPKDRLGFTAFLSSSDIRDDTVAAEIVAAEHYIHTGLERIFPCGGQSFHDLGAVLPDIDDLSAGCKRTIEKLRELVNIMGTEYKIHKRIILPDLFHYMLLLHHTSEKNDFHIRMHAFDAFQMSQMTVDLLVRILTDGTGIVDHDGSLVLPPGLCKSHLKCHTGNGFGLQ